MTEPEKKPQGAGRWCKTCANLAERKCSETGQAYKVCAFTPVRPWAYRFWHPGGEPIVGSRHHDPDWCAANPLPSALEGQLGSDWTEVMDCPTWEARHG